MLALRFLVVALLAQADLSSLLSQELETNHLGADLSVIKIGGSDLAWTNTAGGGGGGRFDSPTREVKKVCTRSGTLLDKIEITFRDGSTFQAGGNGGGHKCFHVDLNAGECIVYAGVRSGTFVDALTLVTNFGRAMTVGGTGGGVGHLGARHANRCLCGVAGRSGTYIDQVQFNYCKPPKPTDFTIRVKADKRFCFNVWGGQYRTFDPINLYPCTASHNELFEFAADKSIRVRSRPKMCLQVFGGRFVSGAKIVIGPCAGGTNGKPSRNERFVLKKDGTIRPTANLNMCMDAWGGVLKSGVPIKLYPCHGKANQVFVRGLAKRSLLARLTETYLDGI